MEPKHILWAVLVTAIWGVNFVVIRLGLDDFPPILLNTLRFSFAGGLFAWFIPRPRIAFWRIAAVGLSLGVAKFTLLFIGMDAGMPAGLSSLVLQSQAFFTVLFATAVLGERPKSQQIVGMAVAFGGLAVIALDLGQGTVTSAFALVLAAAACWGVANLLIKSSGADDMLGLIVWASVTAAPPLIALSLVFEGPERILDTLSHISIKGAGAVAYIVIAATLVGFGLWSRLLKLYPASLVAPFSLLVPVFGLSSAALVLGETLTPLKIAGATLVIIGLAINAGLLRKLMRSSRTLP
jgi:O-acetylserine/cysteine efflux transporter